MGTETKIKEIVSKKVQKMPPWNVVILDSPNHSFEYVIILFCKIFGKSFDQAKELTFEVHEKKRAIAATCSKERAELYKQQVDGLGPDKMIKHCTTSIGCTIEPAE
jgi:ATP-dependent Clp protease adaptor protein ClpS